jgi:hypothetical protein
LGTHCLASRPGTADESPVARQAAGILEAWDRGDRERLAAALATASLAAAKPPPDWHERERAELLADAAADLRAMLAFTGATRAAVPLRLLKHLAAV